VQVVVELDGRGQAPAAGMRPGAAGTQTGAERARVPIGTPERATRD